jgi:predicted O-methyltransferase YrrM
MIDPKIEDYVRLHTTPVDPLLKSLDRETHLKTTHPRMLSGPIQGKVLELFSRMIRPKRILEIGTFTGYSAICLAKGLQDEGLLFTIEVDEEMIEFSNRYFQKAGLTKKIQQIFGPALEQIPTLNEFWDLVFIDADKEHYLDYYHLVIDRVKPGGYILADNALWDGKVVDQKNNTDKETEGIIAFNDYVHRDDRVDNLLLPVRDGLMVLRKI